MKNKIFFVVLLVALMFVMSVSAFAACNHLNQTERIVITGSYTENGKVYITRESRVTCTDCGTDLGWNDLPSIVCPHDNQYEELVNIFHTYDNGKFMGVATYTVSCSLCGMDFGLIDKQLNCPYLVHGQNEQHSQSDGHSTFYETYYKCTEHNDFVAVETEEASEHTVKYSNLFKNAQGKYGKTVTTICNDCGEVVSSVFAELKTDGDLYTLVATSENGERISNELVYYIGFTGKTVGMGAGQNIVSHARRSGFFNDFSNLVVLYKDGKYYVFGCHNLNSFSGHDGNVTDLVGTPVFISATNNSADLVDIMPVGERFETYACQLLYENGVLYYNGKPLALDSLFIQTYKRQFQYLTQTNMLLSEFTRSHWLEDLDFSICRFVDSDNDGDQDLMYYDTRLLIDGYTLDSQNRVKFASCGEDNSILFVDGDTTYSPFTRWLTNNYLTCVDLRNNRTTTENLVYIRMYESATTATCVDNAVVFMENAPTLLKVDLIRHTIDFSDYEKNYLPTAKDFGLKYVYTNGIERVVPNMFLAFENVDGVIKIYVNDVYKYTVSGISWKSADYYDGYTQGRIDALLDNGDGVRAFVEGVWYGLTILFGTVLGGVAIGGYTLGNIVVSFILVFVVILLIKFGISLL